MDSVSFAIAAAPLAAYLIGLGVVNLRRRPVLLSNTQDVVALALAVSGLLIVGPMNLFLPEAAVARLGGFAWLLLLTFVGLCVVLYLLVSRPRLVILNLPHDRLGALLERVSQQLDSEARIVGNAAQFPHAGVQFMIEASPAMRSVSLVASGDEQSYTGWKRLERALTAALREIEVTPNPRGFTMLSLGLVLICWPAVQLLQTPAHVVAQRIIDMLRL